MVLLNRLWFLMVWVLYICFICTFILPLLVFLAKGTIYIEEFVEYTEDLLL
jgi:hypothetical protein